jgi:hypothetical protein
LPYEPLGKLSDRSPQILLNAPRLSINVALNRSTTNSKKLKTAGRNKAMGEAALQLWIDECLHEDEVSEVVEFEDVNLIALGETDQDWLYGAD